jgi:hypothetical protein
MKTKDKAAPVLAAIARLEQCGVEERAIAVLCKGLGTRPDSHAVWEEIKWRSADMRRKRDAALRALVKTLETAPPAELPADVHAILRGDVRFPLWQVNDAVLARLRALVDGVQVEETPFDGRFDQEARS